MAKIKLNLYVCENVKSDYEQVAREFDDEIHIASFSCLSSCLLGKPSVETHSLDKSRDLSDADGSIGIVSKSCLIDKDDLGFKGRLILLESCMEHVLPKGLIDYLSNQKKCLLTQDWVNNWEERLIKLGLTNQQKARVFFRDFANEIIIASPGDVNSTKGLEDYLLMKVNVINLAHETIKSRLSRIVEEEKNTKLKESLTKAFNKTDYLQQQLAKKVVMIDIFDKIANSSPNEDIVDKAQGLLADLLKAKSVTFHYDDRFSKHEGSIVYNFDPNEVYVISNISDNYYGYWVISDFMRDDFLIKYDEEIMIINRAFYMAMERDKLISEIKLSQSKLIHQEKMASVGELAGGLAHEINNPLGYIASNMEILKNYVDEVTLVINNIFDENDQILRKKYKKQMDDINYIIEDTPDMIEEIYDGINRISAIVNRFRAFTDVDAINSRSLHDLNSIIKDVVFIFLSNYHNEVVIDVDLEAIPLVLLNRGEISLTLYDLINNSVEAIIKRKTKEKGNIKIRTFKEKDYVCIEIEDNGVGIEASIHSKVFEPFFSTKEVGAGVGLGLTFAYDVIVHRHLGRVSIESVEQDLTRCSISLPCKNLLKL